MAEDRHRSPILSSDFNVDGFSPDMYVSFAAYVLKGVINNWPEVTIFNIFRWYVNGFLLVFGSVSSIASLLLLQSGNLRKSRARLFLSVFCSIDILILTTMLLPMYITDYSENRFIDNEIVCKFFVYFQSVLVYLSPWLTVAITLERVIAIRYPFKVRKFTMKLKSIVILGIILFWASVWIFIPFLVKIPEYYGMHQDEDEVFNLHVLQHLGLISLCMVQKLHGPIQAVILPIFHFCIPFVLILVGSILIIYELKSGTKKLAETFRNNKMTEERMKRERAASILIIAAAVKYLILMIIGSAYAVITGFAPLTLHYWTIDFEPIRKQIFKHLLSYVCLSCYFLNSSLNFSVYVLSGSEFRNEIRRIGISIVACCKQKCNCNQTSE